MATDTIRRLLFTPPVAIARLGGSSTPIDAFDWGPGDPHTIAETRVRPAWSLAVDPDGRGRPHLPTEVVLRDGPLLRPVAPFLELWALVGDGPASGWRPLPVTPALLAANGVTAAQVRFTVSAVNRKAARRTGNSALRFGTFPPVVLAGNAHAPVELRGESPPDAVRRMIPAGRSIRLGSVQVLRPVTPPANPPWPPSVRVDVLRLRFTPGPGRMYGPPAAAQAQSTLPPAVPADRAFLDPAAGWFDARRGDRVVPPDTADERAGFGPGNERSLGVVDDTCDAGVVASLTVGGATLRARANISVGPPHFGPDRRPFLSLADEINDRQHDPARDAAMGAAQRADWVEDLFERIFETVGLMDVDYWRDQVARPLQGIELTASTIPGDGVAEPGRAMGGRDALRDREIAVPGRSDIEPLPLSARARERHRTLSDLTELAPWVLAHPGRLRALVRPPFVQTPRDAAGWSMQMPAFMRQSNAGPLSLARWQYDLLMAWADALAAAPGAPAPLTDEAALRRGQVLAALDEGQP